MKLAHTMCTYMYKYLVNVVYEALEEHPDMFFGECLLVVHLSVNVAVVKEVYIDLLHLKK